MTILAIETSCDDTCCALLQADKHGFKILSNIISSQIKVHAPYGGIVPSLAAREHTKNILVCLEKALKVETQQCCVSTTTKKIKKQDIDLVSVTIGPGLAPCLLVGVTAAKALAYAWQRPLIGINHLEGHLFANWLVPISSNPKFKDLSSVKPGGQNSKSRFKISEIEFPAIGLIVSGGHTMLVLIRDFGQYQVLGQTRDDAAGEAFDKIARVLGLGYPGGPAIAACAAQVQKTKNYKLKIKLPRPMMHTKNYDFSFSGLKTAVLYDFKKRSSQLQKSSAYIQAMTTEVQQAICDVLITKTIRAVKEFDVKTVMLAGGVAANQKLRQLLNQRLKSMFQVKLILPEPRFCTDNALMIGLAAYFNAKTQDLKFNPVILNGLEIQPNLGLV